MTDNAVSQSKRIARAGAIGLGVGAIIIWLGARMKWMDVKVFDELSGHAEHTLTGAVWSTESTGLSLLLLAGMVACLALRRTGRRIVALVSAVAAIAVSLSPLKILTAGPDTQRVHQILSSGAASQRANNPISISQWAQVSEIDVASLGPAVMLLGCAAALFGAALVVAKPGQDLPKLSKYERKAQRREHLEEDLGQAPDSGRIMWDALDDDIDPTDLRQQD